MNTKQHKRGLTLIELMVTIVASSIVILTIALVLFMVFKTWRINNAYVDMRRDASLAFYMMARDVREAKYATLTAGNPLTLPSAVVAGQTVAYRQQSGSKKLEYNDGAGVWVSVIYTNVQTFASIKTNDGVLLSLVLADSRFNIGMTNEVFVNTRN